MASFAIFFGNYLIDLSFGKRNITNSVNKKIDIIFHTSSAVLMISGLVNMIILVKENKYLKNSAYKLWKNLIIGKFFLSIMLTPLLEKVVRIDTPGVHWKIRLSIVMSLFLMSPFLRYFREYYLTKGGDQVQTLKEETDDNSLHVN
jgi:uncharacterized membrane protein